MMKIKTLVTILVMALFGVAVAVPATPALAYDPLAGACSSGSTSEVCKNKNEKLEPFVKKIINALLYVVGLLSVVMIIVAGIMYTASSGDSGRISKAKNMLMYSIVGLVVSFMAFAIVNWVVDLF